SNWMGANTSQSRMNPSLSGASSAPAALNWTAKALTDNAHAMINDFVFIFCSPGLLFVAEPNRATIQRLLGSAQVCHFKARAVKRIFLTWGAAQIGRQTRNPRIQSHVRRGRPGDWYLQP